MGDSGAKESHLLDKSRLSERLEWVATRCCTCLSRLLLEAVLRNGSGIAHTQSLDLCYDAGK